MSVRTRTPQDTPAVPFETRRFRSLNSSDGILAASANASCQVNWIDWVATDPSDITAGSWVRGSETAYVFNGPSGRYSFDANTYGEAKWRPDSQHWEVCDQDCP